MAPWAAGAQSTAGLSLERARALARLASPDIVAAREAVAAARGREVQAGALENPVLSYSAERTSRNADANEQQIVGFEQRIEIGGQRGARRSAATSRRRAAEARLESARASSDFEVARAYAAVVAADRRASLARLAGAAFTEAGRVSEKRLAAGDVSVYSDRRLRLEAARYSAIEAEANLARRTARVAMSALIAISPDSIAIISEVLSDSLPVSLPQLSRAVLQSSALRRRADLIAVKLDADALVAESSLAARERRPTPVFSGGFKTEKAAGILESLNGFVAGVAIPFPLWDRRKGAIEAAGAEVRRANAESEALLRRIVREVSDAHDALLAVEQQRAILGPQLGAQSSAALRSAQVAYSEGEITLLEWLDAVRAYYEAESAYASLVAEQFVRLAELERASGAQLRELENDR